MATKSNDACRDKCLATEPIFTLRAQDLSAAELVREWARRNASHLGEAHPKILEAKNVADAMEAWPHRRLPD